MADKKAKPKEKWTTSLWREWVKPLVLVIAIMAPLRSAVADWNDVPTGSMKPTILEGDRVVVNKLAYDLKIPFTTRHLAQWDDPMRGDIVVFWSPADGKRLVKRVVAVPGDTVELRENVVFINGVAAEYGPLSEEVIQDMQAFDRMGSEFAVETIGTRSHAVMARTNAPSMRSFGPVTVPSANYFVMGDNRDESYDSRWIGFIERRRIVGEAIAVAFSLDRERYFRPRLSRFFEGLE